MRITTTTKKVPIRRIAKVVVIAILKAPTQESYSTKQLSGCLKVRSLVI
jgi:hypothetical protein